MSSSRRSLPTHDYPSSTPLPFSASMSFRGGRGGGRGGRQGPGDGLNLAGMTYAEISGSGGKESEELYPVRVRASVALPSWPSPGWPVSIAVADRHACSLLSLGLHVGIGSCVPCAACSDDGGEVGRGNPDSVRVGAQPK